MSVPDILREELETLRKDITNRSIAAGQKATGKTTESLEVAILDGFTGELRGASYIGVLEKGRKPGKIPYNFKDILIRWAKAKGLSFSDDKQLERFAAAVAWKIRNEGTELYVKGGRDDIITPALSDFSDRLAKRAGDWMQTEVIEKIFT